MDKRIEISYTNNMSDRPNNFIRFCSKLCNTFKVSIDFIEDISANNRNYKVRFLGESGLIEINHNYSESILEYTISGFSNEDTTNIDKYILMAFTKVNYKAGDVIFDSYGNIYKVMEDTNIPLSKDGLRHGYKIKVRDSLDNILERDDRFMSSI